MYLNLQRTHLRQSIGILAAVQAMFDTSVSRDLFDALTETSEEAAAMVEMAKAEVRRKAAEPPNSELGD